jgi:hypothetical protein
LDDDDARVGRNWIGASMYFESGGEMFGVEENDVNYWCFVDEIVVDRGLHRGREVVL